MLYRPTLFLALLVASLLYAPVATAVFGFGPHFRSGAVYARALVTNESGNPIYVEYDTSGEIVSEIGAAQSSLARKTIMSGDEYRAYRTLMTEFRVANDFGISRDAELVTKDTYESTNYETRIGEPMVKKTLKASTQSVLIRHSSQRLLPNADQLVLLEFPVNLASTGSLAPSVKSLLLDDEGNIYQTSEHNIGFKVAWFGDDPNDRFGRGSLDDIHGPVPNVKMDMGFFLGGRTVTGSNGKYSMTYFVPPCPGFTFTYNTTMFAELRYRNFRPRGAPTIPYYLYRQDSTFCNGLGAFPPSYSLSGLMAQIAAIGIVATQPTPITRLDFPVDVMMLTGSTAITNRGIDGLLDVALGDTTSYSADEQVFTPIARDSFDFDGDGQIDTAFLGDFAEVNGETVFQPSATGASQGVYFSSGDRSPSAATAALRLPNLTRVPDADPYFQAQGLLTSLSVEDLKNTDIYVFRSSNGKLVMEREGLSDSDVGLLGSSEVHQDAGRFVYRILLRGPGDVLSLSSSRGRDFAQWQADARMALDLHAVRSDHLRAGESVEIVAINRVSGYIGTTTTTLRSAGEAIGGEISFPIDEISMGPPNLKIRAKRAYDIQFGATSGDRAEYIIGYEGSGLTSDSYIEIRTVWLDADGSALPDGLAEFGYSGRLARIDGPGSLASVGGSLANFPIKPGAHLQLVQLQDRILNKQHFYVHVSGQPEYETPNFGANPGVLATRPNHYVPVIVQVHDESATIAQDKAFRQLRRDNPGQVFTAPQAVFREVYRPEYQFSVFDLEVAAVKREVTEDVFVDILNADQPILSSADLGLEFLFSLTGNANDPLPQLGEERKLVLALGEDELQANLLTNGTLMFGNLEHLNFLDVTDFLSIRLYTNNDSANILWEFSFTTLDVDIDSDNNNGLDLPERSQAEEEAEKATNHPGKIIDVNDGDVNDNDVPDFAEFVYLDASNQSVDMRFVPFIIEIPPEADLATATLQLSYSGSDPLAVTSQNNGTADNPDIVYTPAVGIQRIWRTNANESRNPAGVQLGGDYLTPDYIYKVSELGFSRFNLVQVFYIEGIQKTESGDAQIRMVLEHN